MSKGVNISPSHPNDSPDRRTTTLDLSVDRLGELTQQFGGIVDLKEAIRLLKINQGYDPEEPSEEEAQEQQVASVVAAVERHERTKFPASIRLQRKVQKEEKSSVKEKAQDQEEDSKYSNAESATLPRGEDEPNANTASGNSNSKTSKKKSYWLICPDTTKEISACANENHVHENGKRGEAWKALELLYSVSQEVAVEEARRQREDVIENNETLESPPPVEINERMGSEALGTLLVSRSSCDDTNQDLMKLHKRLVHAAAYYVRCHEELAPRALSLSSFSLMLQRPCSLPLVERMIEGLLQPQLRACWKSGRWTLSAPRAQEITNRVAWMCFIEMPDILHDLSTSADVSKLVQSTEGAVRGILGRLADAVGLSQIGAMRWSAADLGRLIGIVPSGRLTLNNCLSSIELDVKCLQQAENEEKGGVFGDCTSMSASVRIIPASKKKSSKKTFSPPPAAQTSDLGKEEEEHPALDESLLVPRRQTLQPEEIASESEETGAESQGETSSFLKENPGRRTAEHEATEESAGLEVVLKEASDSNTLANMGGLELLRQVANEQGLTQVPPSPAAGSPAARSEGVSRDRYVNKQEKSTKKKARLVTADESAHIQGMKKEASPSKKRERRGGKAEEAARISHPLPWQSETSLGSQTHVHAILSGISDEDVRRADRKARKQDESENGPATRKLLGKVLSRTVTNHHRRPVRSVSATPTNTLPPLKQEMLTGQQRPSPLEVDQGAMKATNGATRRSVKSSLAMASTTSAQTEGRAVRSHSSLAGGVSSKKITPEATSLALTAEPKGKTPSFKLPPLKPVKAYQTEQPVGLENLLGDILKKSDQVGSSSRQLQKKKEFQSSAASVVVRNKVPQRTLQRKAQDTREVKDRDLDDFIHREARHPRDARLRPLHLDIK